MQHTHAVRTARKLARLTSRECERCGNSDLDVLEVGPPVLCADCAAIAAGRTTIEENHVAGRANSPVVMRVSVNLHRKLTEAQRSWPVSTLRNLDRSPDLRVAAFCRGIADLLNILAFEFEHEAQHRNLDCSPDLRSAASCRGFADLLNIFAVDFEREAQLKKGPT